MRGRASERRAARAGRTVSVVTSALLLGLVFVIPLVTTSIYGVFLGTGSGTGPLVLLTLLPLLIFVTLNWRSLLIAVNANREIALLILLAPFSMLWSLYPGTTIERSIPLLITSATALTVGAMLSRPRLIVFFTAVMTLTILASFFAIVLKPSSQGIGSWPDAWNGVHNHKNGLGAATMITVMLGAATAAITKGRVRGLAIAVLLLALFLQVGSKSRTSQLMTMIALGGILTGVLWQRFALLWAAAFSTLVISLVLMGAFILGSSIADPIFAALDRKPTLSGRLPLWGIVWPWIEQRPFLGYGYMAFWKHDAAHVVAMASNPKLFFSPFYSHNGVLEMLLALGWFGFGLLVLGLLRAFRGLFSIMRQARDRRAEICLFVILIGLLSQNITESFMLSRTSTGWMMLVALTTHIRLHQKTRPRREAVRPGLRIPSMA